MKRSVIIIGIVFVLGFAAVTVWKETQSNTDLKLEKQPGVSVNQRAKIRRFWDIYHQASDLRQRGEWENALAAYREALTIDPQHEDVLYYFGNILFELEKYEEAVTAWQRLIEVNPLSARAHTQKGMVYSCGAQGAPFDLDIAEKEFQRALAINKEETGPILKLAEVYLLKGQRKKALTFFTTALQTNVKSIEAHYLTGYLKWLDGDREAARSALRNAVEFSKTKKTGGAQLGEGDTRSEGGGPILVQGASRRNFFVSHWKVLKTWENGNVSIRQMDKEYRQLDRQIKLLVEK